MLYYILNFNVIVTANMCIECGNLSDNVDVPFNHFKKYDN